ncbi:MAG TPA: dihydroneopterin aldolase [Candidatus Dormibacteraeota bacterium]|nr:dihydroneopterin aldolase [Candidatus Dormibacteraeota bacterium]
MPVLYIKDLVVEGKHGVHPHEKETTQRFKVTAELTIDTSKATQSDGLADTINWSELRDMIVNIVQNKSFGLIERLAQELADQIMADQRVDKLVLSVDKLDAFPNGVPGIRIETDHRPRD